MQSAHERRVSLRTTFDRPEVAPAASVFDPVSARLAQSFGAEVGMFAGTIASHVVLGAPDLVLLTLSELVEQARRITRACDLPLLVDGDHGYGTSLSVARTVEELETAGVAALFIEDTVLPRAYAAPMGEQIGTDEFRDKLRAAVAARSDSALILIGRTTSLNRGDLAGAVERARAARDAGVDAVFAIGARKAEEVSAVHEACRLPILLQNPLDDRGDLPSLGVRFVVPSHLPYFAAMKALYEAYEHLASGGTRATLIDRSATRELIDQALAAELHAEHAVDFLAISPEDAIAWMHATNTHTHRV